MIQGTAPRANIGGSDANHTVTPASVLEKTMTLTMGLLVRDAVVAANGVQNQVSVIMTRSSDVNLSLAARANVARDRQADLLLSIHFNGFDGKTRARSRPSCARRPTMSTTPTT